MFAIRNFNTGNALRINADLLDSQMHVLSKAFEELAESHQSMLASFGRLKLAHSQTLASRHEMERQFEENLSTVTTKKWPNGKPKSAHEIQTLLERLRSKVIKPTGLVSEMIGRTIEATDKQIEQVDNIFKSASIKHDQVMELLANRDCSPATRKLMESLSSDMSEALRILTDTANLDDTLEERNRIRAKIGREKSKIQNALARISK